MNAKASICAARSVSRSKATDSRSSSRFPTVRNERNPSRTPPPSLGVRASSNGCCLPRGGTVRSRAISEPPLERHRDVAGPAQQPVIVETAFAAALGDRHDVIRFPARSRGAPAASRGPIARRRTLAAPSALGAPHVEPTQSAHARIPRPDLFADIAGIAAQLPFVHARVAAEGAARWANDGAAPAANRVTGGIAIGNAPVLG